MLIASLALNAFFVFYILFAVLDALTPQLRCSRPMPDDHLPWDRCSGTCSWCDYMERWAREPREDGGPYRVDGRRSGGTMETVASHAPPP